MTMNRVIHAAVRRDLARLESALDHAPDGDRGRAEGLCRAYGHLHEELTRHHQGEDELIFPMLAGFDVDPILLEEMDSEHQAMAQALEETDAAMSEYATIGSADSAAKAKETVAQARHVVERHLDHEEHELEPLFTPHEDSPEWKAVEKQLRKAPPGVAGRFFAWLQDGMGPKERDYLAATVPAPVRFVLSKGFGRAYHRDIAPVWKAS